MYKEHSIEWDDIKIARFWNTISKNKSLTETYFTKMVGKEVIKDIGKEIGIAGKKVLDYGSGPGHLFESILRLKVKLKYFALEFSKDSIDELEKRFGASPNFETGYYVNTFPSTIKRQFDIIICCEVVEHLGQGMLNSFIVEVKRLLKPGGYVYITTPNEENLNLSKVNCPDCGCTFHRWQHVRSWDSDTLRGFMEDNGFKTHTVKTLNYFERKNKLLQVKSFIRDKVLRKVTKKSNLCYIGKL